MIRRSEEIVESRVEHKFEGEGYLLTKSLIRDNKDLNDKGRMFAHTKLNPGCEIGYHVHHGDTEFYYILKGEGEYNDNGKITTVKAGDVTRTPDGEGHSIRNTGTETLEFIALIVFN